MKKLLQTALVLGLTTGIAQAQDVKTILDLEDGQSIMHISANAQQDVEQDLLIATLRFEAEDDDPVSLQNTINKTMADALATSKKEADVKVQTLGYSVYEFISPEERRKSKISGTDPQKSWKGQQSLRLESKNFETVLKLTGELQEKGLLMGGLSFQLSPEQHEIVQNALIQEALQKLTTRAQEAAKALGKSKAELRMIHVNNNGGYHTPVIHRGMMMESAAMSADIAPPVANAGETTVSLSVSAQALLSR